MVICEVLTIVDVVFITTNIPTQFSFTHSPPKTKQNHVPYCSLYKPHFFDGFWISNTRVRLIRGGGLYTEQYGNSCDNAIRDLKLNVIFTQKHFTPQVTIEETLENTLWKFLIFLENEKKANENIRLTKICRSAIFQNYPITLNKCAEIP